MNSSSRSCRVPTLYFLPIEPRPEDRPRQRHLPARAKRPGVLAWGRDAGSYRGLADACLIPRVTRSGGSAHAPPMIVVAIGVVHATTITIGPRSAGRIA